MRIYVLIFHYTVYKHYVILIASLYHVESKLAVLNLALKSFRLFSTAFKSVTRVLTSPLISDSAVLKLLTSVFTSAFISFARVMTVGKSVESAESTLTV